jgi:epsilon-lactone hydrolase
MKLTGFLFGIAAIMACAVDAYGQQPTTSWDETGALSIPAFKFPYSELASPEARQAYVGALDSYKRFPPLDPRVSPEEWRKTLGRFDAVMYSDRVARLQALYPVQIEAQTMGGVRTEVFTPKSAIAPRNKGRVLINLHGGAFMIGGGGPGGRFESIAMASLGQIKVVAVDYRQGPQHQFPAASEDVATVYKELLKTYKPANIGIYGSSAGGILTAQAVAWLQKEKLPRPGAIGIFAAGATPFGQGDSSGWGAMSLYTPPTAHAPPRMGYMGAVKDTDPLAYPAVSPQVIRQFPPTLLMSGTRGGEMSSTVVTHAKMVKEDVDASLYIIEGGWHGSMYWPDVPEARDALVYATKWFDRHLGR